MKASEGDAIVVEGHRVGQNRRVGVIVEVKGPDGSPPFRVRWEGEDEAHLFVPGSDAVVRPAGA